MAKPTKEASVEEYMEIARKGDIKGLQKFIDDCFGSGDDLDKTAVKAFAEIVLPKIEQEMINEIEKANNEINEEDSKMNEETNTVEQKEAVEAKAKEAVEDGKENTATEATVEAAKQESEDADKS